MLGLSKEELIAVAIGATVQLIFTTELTVMKTVVIFISSIFVGLYVVRPIIEYYSIHGTFVEAIYATTATISRNILLSIVTILPGVLKVKAFKALGVDYDDYIKITKDKKGGNDG